MVGSKELIRDINSHLILETILNEGPVSRATVSTKVGLTKATVSAIVSELIDKQLIREIGSDDTSLGRKPILLEFCHENGNVISIDLGVDTITVFTSDLKGNHCGLKQYKNSYDKSNISIRLINLIDETIDSLSDTPLGVVGITIALHGIVLDNNIIFAPYYDYSDLPIAKDIEDKFGIPVSIENEANLLAIGERAFRKNSEDLVALSVHSGIGAGIIVDGKLHFGRNGLCGEIGHSIVVADGKPCPCGNNGCLEQYASEKAILKEYSARKGIVSITLDEFVSAYNHHDEDAIEIIKQFSTYISVGINNLLHTVDPDVIVINSLLVTYIPELIDMIKEKLQNRMSKYCKLEASSLQDSSILIGGIVLAMQNYLGVSMHIS